MRLGYHMSTSGGYKKQIPLAREIGAETIQVFIGSPTSWRLSALNENALRDSGRLAEEAGIGPLLVHSAYLINMASKNEENFQKSRALLAETLKRAQLLGAPYVVTHIGSHGGEGLPYAYQRIAQMLDELRADWPEGVTLLLENTAGAGHGIGGDLAEIGQIIYRAGDPEWLGVCFDTCHAWVYGYPLDSEEGWRQTLQQFDDQIGLRALKFLHLNDTEKERGSKKDRHANIGEGRIGRAGFRAMFAQEALREIPGVLETPDEGDNESFRRDLALLKQLRDELQGR